MSHYANNFTRINLEGDGAKCPARPEAAGESVQSDSWLGGIAHPIMGVGPDGGYRAMLKRTVEISPLPVSGRPLPGRC